MTEMLPGIMISIIGFSILMYVLLDGFDLGIGILYPLFPDDNDKDYLMSSIAPVWDGNGTWLVYGGAALYGAFPLAFSLLLPMLYMPIMIMIVALLLRGVCFEFRLKAKKSKPIWNVAFFFGSIIATLCQGMMLGAFIEGFPLHEVGDPVPRLEWLNAFSLFTGVALVFGYALLGATWAIKKCEGEVQTKMKRYATISLFLSAVCLVVASIWSPFIDTSLTERWLTMPNMLYLAPLPISTIIIAGMLYYALQRSYDVWPFFLSMFIFVLSFLGFAISTWPYIVPRVVTVSEAASPDSSLSFMIIGSAIMMPLLLCYTFYAYYLFRGKVKTRYY